MMWLCNKLLYFGTVFAVLSVSSARTASTSPLKLTRENFVDEKALCNQNQVCIKEVNQILNNVDFSVDPCDDFYNFTCGTFFKNNEIPEGSLALTPYHDSSELRQDIYSLVRKDIMDTDIRPIKLAKNFFKSCSNLTKLQELNYKPVLELFTQLGGWPLITKDWDEKNFDVHTVLTKLGDMGFGADYIIRVTLIPDPINSTKFIVGLTANSDDESKEYFRMGLDNENVQNYISKSVDLIVDNIDNKTDSKYFRNELINATKFEVNLANISLTAQQASNKSLLYNVMTIEKVIENYPYFPWLGIINSQLPLTGKLTINDNVTVMDTKFFAQLDGVLRKTPKRDQANYIMLKVLRESLNYIEKVPSNDTTSSNDRWNKCITDLKNNFGLAVGSLYIKNYIDSGTKEIVSEMAYKIRDQIVNSIQQSSWMDPETQKRALNKLNTIKFIIGNPKELEDDKNIVDYYAKLDDMKPNEYLLNSLKIKKFEKMLAANLLKNEQKKSDIIWWLLGSRTVEINAFYAGPWNTMFVPAGIIRGKYYSKNKFDSINYGALGYVIGHELTHSIDSEGRKYDEYGNFVNWWEKETEEKFLKKSKCVEDLYNNFDVEFTNKTIDGITTLSENIADLGGCKHSFLAYQEKVLQQLSKGQLDSRYVPQLDKLFWISLAQSWCLKYNQKGIEKVLAEDNHSPPHFRVLGSLQSSQNFPETFGCKPQSPMNPVHKCEVW